MSWSSSSSKALCSPSQRSRRAPKRNRSLVLEDLEGRRLLSGTIQPVVTVPSAGQSSIISGPDGDLWVGLSLTPTTTVIDRIGLDGSVTSFPVPGNATGQFWIVALTNGPDGNVWFVADSDPSPSDNQVVVGDVTPAGQVTEFPPVPMPAGDVSLASGMVSGPDGDLWFGYTADTVGPKPQSQNFIGRVTTAGAVTLFPVSSNSHAIEVSSLAAGADGNLWFTEGAGSSFAVGRMSPNGVVTRIPIQDQSWGQVGNGLNGNLILVTQNSKARYEVFQVSTAGAVTRYKIPAAVSGAFEDYLGTADGSLWFDGGVAGPFKIGQITASGVAESHNQSKAVRGRQHFGDSMAVGQDGNLYVLDNPLIFTAITPATVYRISPINP